MRSPDLRLVTFVIIFVRAVNASGSSLKDPGDGDRGEVIHPIHLVRRLAIPSSNLQGYIDPLPEIGRIDEPVILSV